MTKDCITPPRTTTQSALLRFCALSITLLSLALGAMAQPYTDGPIVLKAKLRQFNLSFAQTDVGIFGVTGTPDDMTYNLWFRDAPDIDGVTLGSGWGAGSGCLIEPYVLPLTDFNVEIFNHTYTGPLAPQFLEMRTNFWEDESPDQVSGVACAGTRCAYETLFCCGPILFGNCGGLIDSDDLPCNSSLNAGGAPYATLNYRLGLPGVWYDHGPVSGTCANNVYLPRIETYWRYAGGENCATAINLGTLQPGFSPITHTNAVNGYLDDITYAGGGADVVYKITVAQPIGLTVGTCGAGTLLSDVLILDASCNIIASNSGACGNGSSITRAMCVPGDYYIAVEARGTALGSFTLDLTEQVSLTLIANAGPDTVACPGLPIQIGAITPALPVTGGTGPFIFSWTPPTGLSSTTLPTPTAANLSSQTYVFSVTDASGCVDTDTMQFAVLGTTFSLGADTNLCPGDSITLTAPSGAASYAWSNGATSASITVNTAGSYSVTLQAASGCQLSDTIAVGLNTVTPPNLGPDTAICPTAFIAISANVTASAYLWSNSSTANAISTNTPGTYAVTVTDANGCTSADTMVLGWLPVNPPYLGPDTVLCADTSFTLDAPAGYTTYSWSTFNSTPSIVVNTGGIYSVTVTEATGCTSSDTMEVLGLTDCVFPGDVNYDNGVDINDVLTLALYIGNSGTTRPMASNDWRGQPATDWSGWFFPVNYKQADTDGDGSLTQDDTLAIQQNWGRTHTRITGATGADMHLRFEAASNPVIAGNPILYNVYLEGDGGTALDSVHGLSFRVSWNPGGMVANALRETDFSTCWFTGPGNHMEFSRAGTNAMELVVSRTNGVDASGMGLVGTLSFGTSAALPNGQAFDFHPVLSQAQVISSGQVLRFPVVRADTVLVTDSTSRIEAPLHMVGLPYPNPANTAIHIEFDGPQTLEMQLLSPFGQLLRVVAINGMATGEMRTGDLPTDVYLLKLVYAGHETRHKVLVQH